MLARMILRATLIAAFVWAGAGQAAPVAVIRPAPPGPPLRVLLAGQLAMRDAQFLRTLLAREMGSKRADLSLYVQAMPGEAFRPGALAHSPGKVLEAFPATFGKLKGAEKERANNLASYDVVVACDLDLEKLGKPALTALSDWVKAGGGLVVVAGPMNTPRLAGPAGKNEEAKAARALLPVVLDKASDEPTTNPRRLKFSAKGEAGLLKLDGKGKGPLAGWPEFFDDGKKKPAAVPERGFYHSQAVKSVKKTAKVLATLGPASPKHKGQPFLVVMPQGTGRVLYIGSPELWRLRAYKEEAHERLWLQLLWYSASRARGA